MATLRVIDTSAWIEWLIGSETGATLAADWPDREACIVPTIVQLELAKWAMREVGEAKADQIIAHTLKCNVVPLDTRLALIAADLHREHALATADAIVYASARHFAATLVTCDSHFDGLPLVAYHPNHPGG